MRMLNMTAARCLHALREHCAEEQHIRSRQCKVAAVLQRRGLAKGYRTWYTVSWSRAHERRLALKVRGRLGLRSLACSVSEWREVVSRCVWLRGVFGRVAECEQRVQLWVVEHWGRVCVREAKVERFCWRLGHHAVSRAWLSWMD